MEGMEAFIESVAACRIIRVLDWPRHRKSGLAYQHPQKKISPDDPLHAILYWFRK